MVDGEPVNMDKALTTGQLSLSPGSHRIAIEYGPTEDVEEQPLRLRYQLEGVDDGWQEAGGKMRFTVRLSNARNDPVLFHDYAADGISDGWEGSPTNSTFSDRVESLLVTRDAASVHLGLATGLTGGRFPDTLGLMIIDDIKASFIRKGETEEQLFYNCNFEAGRGLNPADDTPTDWQRAVRSHPEMHQVVFAGPVTGNHALAVLDTGPRVIAAWNCKVPGAPKLRPGDRLILRWKEMYTIGAGGSQTASYRHVPPGERVFRVVSASPLGVPDGHETALTIILPKLPLWRSPRFIITLLAIALVAFVAEAVWLMRQRLKRQMERLKWQQAVERERARIARDIHDDLGTNLTRIAMLSESARETVDTKSISSIAREMTLAMDEIVWAVNPENDSLDGLATYLGGYAQELLSSANLRCRLDLPVQLPQWNLTADARHNVFLAFKEALNNVLKHSGADKVNVSLVVEPSQFILSVKDNGRGFKLDGMTQKPSKEESASKLGGNGLANMQARMEKIGGKFAVTSSPGQGTTVSFSVPMSVSQFGQV